MHSFLSEWDNGSDFMSIALSSGTNLEAPLQTNPAEPSCAEAPGIKSQDVFVPSDNVIKWLAEKELEKIQLEGRVDLSTKKLAELEATRIAEGKARDEQINSLVMEVNRLREQTAAAQSSSSAGPLVAEPTAKAVPIPVATAKAVPKEAATRKRPRGGKDRVRISITH